MTTLGVFLIVCGSCLFAQYRHHLHQVDNSQLADIKTRIDHLEAARVEQYNHASFEDLKAKVEALRFAQGLKR